jgi:RNA polymerase sigma-70 factor (ECF subfamily)
MLLVSARPSERREPALRRAREDPRAFAEFYAAQSEPLLVYFARRTLDAQAAVDLCAETFAQAFAGRGRFRGRTEEEARGWLYAIASRQLARFLREGAVERRAMERLGMATPAVSEDDAAEIERRAGVAALRATLERELSRLSDAQRAALQLRVVEQLPYDEVARRLELSEPAARARVSRALRVLLPRMQAATRGATDA